MTTSGQPDDTAINLYLLMSGVSVGGLADDRKCPCVDRAGRDAVESPHYAGF